MISWIENLFGFGTPAATGPSPTEKYLVLGAFGVAAYWAFFK